MDSSTILTLRDATGAALSAAMQRSPVKAPGLATQAGISVSRLYQLGKGHSPVLNGPAAVALSGALDVDVSALFTFADGPELVRLGLVDA